MSEFGALPAPMRPDRTSPGPPAPARSSDGSQRSCGVPMPIDLIETMRQHLILGYISQHLDGHEVTADPRSVASIRLMVLDDLGYDVQLRFRGDTLLIGDVRKIELG